MKNLSIHKNVKYNTIYNLKPQVAKTEYAATAVYTYIGRYFLQKEPYHKMILEAVFYKYMFSFTSYEHVLY